MYGLISEEPRAAVTTTAAAAEQDGVGLTLFSTLPLPIPPLPRLSMWLVNLKVSFEMATSRCKIVSLWWCQWKAWHRCRVLLGACTIRTRCDVNVVLKKSRRFLLVDYGREKLEKCKVIYKVLSHFVISCKIIIIMEFWSHIVLFNFLLSSPLLSVSLFFCCCFFFVVCVCFFLWLV